MEGSLEEGGVSSKGITSRAFKAVKPRRVEGWVGVYVGGVLLRR